jgi:hypothetical protein
MMEGVSDVQYEPFENGIGEAVSMYALGIVHRVTEAWKNDLFC